MKRSNGAVKRSRDGCAVNGPHGRWLVYSLLVYLSIEDGDVLRITDDFNGTVFEKRTHSHRRPVADMGRHGSPARFPARPNMCTSADDYESASELLFNGVQVTVLATLPTMGGYPSNLFDDPDEMWAYISVGETKEYAGAMGYVPLVCLATEDPGTRFRRHACHDERNGLHQRNG